MIDLTKIDKPFGQLDEETQAALVIAVYVKKQPCENAHHCNDAFVKTNRPNFLSNVIYRLAPKNRTQFDWSQAAPKLKYLRRDSDGGCYLYRELPKKGDECWVPGYEHTGPEYICAEFFASYIKGDEDWETFKMDRPE